MTLLIGRSKQAVGWLLFLAFLLLLFLPNVIWLLVAQGNVLLRALLIPAAITALLFAVFGRRIWLACTILAPFAVLAPLEGLYIYRFQNPSTAAVLATVFASNPREIREYLGGLLTPVCLVTALSLTLTLVTVWCIWRADLRWQHRSRKMVLAVLIGTPLLVTGLALLTSKPEVLERMKEKTPGLVFETVSQGYPFGIVTRLAEYHEQWLLMRDNAARIAAFRFNASQVAPSEKRQIYVLVIGESSNRTHWQLFGYPRDTNPELMQAPNIVLVPDMLSPWAASVFAIPQLLTRRPIDESKKPWPEASVVRAMSEAGFETFWISNQLPLGRYDSAVSVYADEAAHRQFLNHASWRAPGEFDEDLIEPLRNALDGPARDLFIVLHMMGSHQSYDFRYPPASRHFQPIVSSSEQVQPESSFMVNSYDNTIFYTDHVLAQIIATLRARGEISALWYQSDHGEVTPTETCRRSGRGLGSRYEYEIPALFWYSDEYAAAYPDRVATLKANAHNRTLSADTFESLIDMAGVTFRGHDETHSLFSTAWEYRPRIVNYYWSADYDQATFSKGCEVVVPGKQDPSVERP